MSVLTVAVEVDGEQRESKSKMSATQSEGEFGSLGLCVSSEAVRIKGEKLRALFDEQATRSILTEQTAKRLALDITDTGRAIKVSLAVQGEAHVEPERVAQVEVTLVGEGGKSLSFNAAFHVSRVINRNEVVIGRDILSFLSRKNNLVPIVHLNAYRLTLAGGDTMTITANEGATAEDVAQLFVTEITTTRDAAERMTQGAEPAARSEPEFAEREQRLRREFADVFAEPVEQEQQGRLPSQLDIELTGELPPKRIPRMHDFSPAQREFLDARMDHLLRVGVVAPIEFDHAQMISPFFCVPKPKRDPAEATKWREVCDYRALNAITKKEEIITPKIEELLQRVAAAHLLSVLDVRSAFHLVPTTERAQRLLAFVDHRGRLLTFRAAPFGASGSPAAFWRGLETALGDMRARGVNPYCDDLAVGTSENVDEHEAILRELLLRCRKYNIKLNDKCDLFKRKVVFLGRRVGHLHIEPIIDSDGLEQYPSPSTRTALRSFLGLTNHFRAHIRRYSIIAQPLYQLTSPIKPFVWSPQAEEAFQALKSALASPTVLRPPSPDPSTPTRVSVDASLVGVGAHVEQFVEGSWRTTSLFSTTLSPREMRYGATAREALALLYAVRRYRHFLEHRSIVFLSDCLPLVKALQGAQPPQDPRWERVFADLLMFNFTIVHVDGTANAVADALSRPDISEKAHGVTVTKWRAEGAGFFATDLTPVRAPDESWAEAYKKDKTVARIWSSLASKDANAEYLARKYHIRDGLLYFTDPLGNVRLVIPVDKIQDALQHFHDEKHAGHPGAERQYWRMARSVYFRHMPRLVDRYVRGCKVCAQHKRPLNTVTAMQPLEVPARVMSHLAIDIIGGLPEVRGTRGSDEIVFDSCLTITDVMSRYTAFLPCSKHLGGREAATLLLEDFCVARGFGYPDVVISDGDPRFRAEAFRSALGHYGIKQHMTVRDHAEANGAAEVMNRSLSQYLRIFCSHQPQRWPEFLKFAEVSANSNVNASLGRSPAQVLLGFQPHFGWRTPSDAHQPASIPEALQELEQSHRVAWQAAQDQLNATRDDYVISTIPKARPVSYSVGDLVWLATDCLVPPELREVEHKLAPRFSGPYKVIRVLSAATVQLELPRTTRAHSVVGVKDLKPYVADEFPGRPLRPSLDPAALKPGTFEVERITDHRKVGRRLLFRVKWLGYPEEESTFEPLSSFCDSRGNVITTALRDYVTRNQLDVPLDVEARRKARGTSQ